MCAHGCVCVCMRACVCVCTYPYMCTIIYVVSLVVFIHVFYFIFSKKLLKMLQQQFLYIVQQLTNICWDINQSTIISDIKQKLSELSIFHISDEDIHVITQVLTSQTTDSMTIELLTDVEKCLLKCLTLFKECLNMTNKVGEDVTDDLQYMLTCEKLKTYLSMAEVLLCNPVSPVDHVMYHTVKHDCLQHVVSFERSHFNTK